MASIYSGEGAVGVLQGRGHGVAFPASERASEGRERVGLVLEMLKE